MDYMKNTKISLIHMHLFFDGNEKIINTKKKKYKSSYNESPISFSIFVISSF
jgi:hypothetical protein